MNKNWQFGVVSFSVISRIVLRNSNHTLLHVPLYLVRVLYIYIMFVSRLFPLFGGDFRNLCRKTKSEIVKFERWNVLIFYLNIFIDSACIEWKHQPLSQYSLNSCCYIEFNSLTCYLQTKSNRLSFSLNCPHKFFTRPLVFFTHILITNLWLMKLPFPLTHSLLSC